jgi:molybdenum cofactor cytidylyltransferase
MIAALILAAGQSRRMGQPKMLLPWGESTVIEQVIQTFLKVEINHVVVVTGGAHEQVEKALRDYPIRNIYNPDFAAGEMLSSIQHGLRALPREAKAVLIGLGDQPQIQERTVQQLCHTYLESNARLVVPSFHLRRGHPWLVASPLWADLLEMRAPQSPRAFLNRHAGEIQYVNVGNPSILADLDTPEDYQKARP